MHKPHLALPTRPEPEALARRWFSYFMMTVAAAIIGIVSLLLFVPERPGPNPRKGVTARIGTLAPPPPVQKTGSPPPLPSNPARTAPTPPP
jgi:hypothetical protein